MVYKHMINNKKVIAIIPARLQSTRLPEKLLCDLCGKPLIVRTYEAIVKSIFIDKILIAVDSEKIKNVCDEYGIDSIMTDPELKSGSDRIYSAYQKLDKNYDYILNVQGDEPLIDYQDLDNLIESFAKSSSDVGTIYNVIKTLGDLENPNNVKLIFDQKGDALYFSRNVIPHLRDTDKNLYLSKHNFFKHIGIYLYSERSLKEFVNYDEGSLEGLEKLEQLRLLENGKTIYCSKTENEIHGVDTIEDLEKVREIYEECGKPDPCS